MGIFYMGEAKACLHIKGGKDQKSERLRQRVRERMKGGTRNIRRREGITGKKADKLL